MPSTIAQPRLPPSRKEVSYPIQNKASRHSAGPLSFNFYATGGFGAEGAPGVFGAAAGAGAGAAGAPGAGAAPSTPTRLVPHSEHSVASLMFISPQCGHLMRSSGNSAPHFTHFSATAGLIIPHSGHVFGVDAAAGLKHMVSFFLLVKPACPVEPSAPRQQW